MNDLIRFQNQRIQALETRNLYLENELKQAKKLFQDLINDWEVNDAQVVELDNMFENPIDQINNFFS